jgi:hypothetical protein
VVTSDFHLSRAAWVFRKILGPGYDFSLVAAPSRLSPRELIDRALEECRITIFLNEWLQALEDADEHAIERLIRHEHPGYADAPTLTHEEMRRVSTRSRASTASRAPRAGSRSKPAAAAAWSGAPPRTVAPAARAQPPAPTGDAARAHASADRSGRAVRFPVARVVTHPPDVPIALTVPP